MIREKSINLAQSHLIYEVDENTRVTPLTIQQIFNHANKPEMHQTMKSIFDLLQNLKTLNNAPQNKGLKEKIVQNVEQLKSKEGDKNQIKDEFLQYRFDINRFYTMNKAGGIGMIERKCKFTEKGVMQYEEGKKQPKLKQIMGFRNVIQKYNQKGNMSKLDWIKENSKYPFRIVLIDKNKADKGIYFQTLQQAMPVQVYLIQKYNSKSQAGNVSDMFKKLSKYQEDQVIESFASKLKNYSEYIKQMRKSSDKNKEITQNRLVSANSSGQVKNPKTKYDKQSVLDNNHRQSNTLSQYYFYQKRASNQIFIEDSKTQVNYKKKPKPFQNEKKIKIDYRQMSKKLKNYNDLNVINFFNSWKQRTAHARKTSKQASLIGDRVSQTSLKSSRNIMNGFDNKMKVQNAIQEAQINPTNLLEFNSIQLYFNSNIPLKPYLKLSLTNWKSRNDQQQILNYNTFQSLNQSIANNHSVYDLVADHKQDSNQQQVRNEVLVSKNYSNYILNITLLNTITGDSIFQKQLNLNSIQLFGQNFTLSVFDSNQNNSIEEKQELLMMKIIGKVSNNNQQKSTQNPFNYLFMNIDFLLHSQTQNKQKPLNNEFNKQHIITLIPELQQQVNSHLKTIINQPSHQILNQSSYLPIENLRTIHPTQQELSILTVSAQLFNKIAIQPVSYNYLLILRMLIETNLFPTQQELQEGFIAIISNWSGQFLSCNNSEYNLAKTIGFQDNQIDKVSQKITVSMQVLQFLLNKQCPSLLEKLNRRNIPLVYLCIDYCHNMLVNNLQARVALSILTHIFNSPNKSHEILLMLVVVYLCKSNEDQLKNCYKLQEVQYLLQNNHKQAQNQLSFLTDSSIQRQIQTFIENKWEQYFSQSSRLSHQYDFDRIKSNFYEKEADELRTKKQRRFAQKSSLTQKFIQTNDNFSIKPPSYKPKQHCLHIYFVSVPKISGSLYLKTTQTEFQCVDYQNNPYFVISNLDSKVQLQFIDSKSNRYSFDLVFDRGFGFFKHQFSDVKNSVSLRFQYWSGLFEEQTINQKYRNIRDIESSLSSELTIRDLKYQLNIQFDKSKLMRAIQKVCYNNGKSDSNLQQLGRKIKTAFSQFQNKVNEYDLFLHLVAQRKVSLEQKLYTIFEFAKAISEELFLSENYCFDRVVLYDFLKLMQIPIKFREFEAMYQNMLSKVTQTCVPKVFKARFFFMYEQLRQIKLQNQLYEYIYERAQKYLYTDIDTKELLNYLKPIILSQISIIEKQTERKIKLDEGELKLVISSQGEVKHYLLKVNITSNNRQFTVEDQSLPEIGYLSKLDKSVPKVLSLHQKTGPSTQKQVSTAQIDQSPSSALKIMSRYMTTNLKSTGSVQSRFNPLLSQNETKQQTSLDISQFERTNLCKFVVQKSRRIIPFRYKTYPKEVSFKDFSLFSDLNLSLFSINQNRELQSIKQIYLNNHSVNTLQFLNSQQFSFKVGAGENAELYDYRPDIGLANNLHLVKQRYPQLNKVYFYSAQSTVERQLTGKVLINHEFGVIRWQNATVKGYYNVKSQKKNKKHKIVYLVLVNDRQMLTQQKYLKATSLSQVKFLGQITDKNLSKMIAHRI